MSRHDEPTAPTQLEYIRWVQATEPGGMFGPTHRSTLGAGNCPMCGRPRCDGGRECWEYSEAEYAALMRGD